MADITITNVKAEYEWMFQRGASTASRTVTIDDVTFDAAGVSKAKAFRDIFTGAASSPFTAIDATKFWQPTGWRDTDATEEEWETVGCNLSIIKTDEWQVEGGGGTGKRARNFISEVRNGYLYMYYEGSDSEDPYVYDSDGQTVSVDMISDPTYLFRIAVTQGKTYFIFAPAQGEYAPLSESVTV